MRKSFYFLTLLISFYHTQAQETIGDDIFKQCAIIHLKNGLKTMGGLDTIQSFRSLYLDGYGHRYLLDRSERSEGPFLIEYQKFEETRDLQNKRFRRVVKLLPDKATRTILYDDRIAVMEEDGEYSVLPEGIEEEYIFSPEKILFTGLKSKNLSCEQHEIFQGIVNNVVRFSWRTWFVKLYLNSFTNLPTAYEITRPFKQDNFHIWGPDIKTVVTFSDWSFVPEGKIWYPHQWNITQNGMPYKSLSIMEMKVNVPIKESEFNIPDKLRKVNPDSINRKTRMSKVAPDIWMVKLDRYYRFLAESPQGIYILDAPGSQVYSKYILKCIDSVSGKKPAGVINCSDSWNSIAGLPVFASSQVPITTLDLNEPLLKKLFLISYVKNNRINTIYQDTPVGEQFRLIPQRSESGERNLLVYFPDKQLLYVTDLISLKKDGTVTDRHKLLELNQVLIRKGLEVKKICSMYFPIMDFAELMKQI
jgi:hypothetical protein